MKSAVVSWKTTGGDFARQEHSCLIKRRPTAAHCAQSLGKSADSSSVEDPSPLLQIRLDLPATLHHTASTDWKQAVSSATVSGREIWQNHFFKNQIFHAQKQRKYLFFDKLWDICAIKLHFFIRLRLTKSYCWDILWKQQRASVTQLVEYHVANVTVAGSNPVTRSNFFCLFSELPVFILPVPVWDHNFHRQVLRKFHSSIRRGSPLSSGYLPVRKYARTPGCHP